MVSARFSSPGSCLDSSLVLLCDQLIAEENTSPLLPVFNILTVTETNKSKNGDISLHIFSNLLLNMNGGFWISIVNFINLST